MGTCVVGDGWIELCKIELVVIRTFLGVVSKNNIRGEEKAGLRLEGFKEVVCN
jgi:hypothetical protein